MKKGKLFPLSVLFLTCCSLQAAAEGNLTTNPAPATALSRPLQNSSYNLSFLNIFCTFIV